MTPPPTAGKKRPQPAPSGDADNTPIIEEVDEDAPEADERPPSEDTTEREGRADAGRGAAGRTGRGGGRGSGRGSGFQRQ